MVLCVPVQFQEYGSVDLNIHSGVEGKYKLGSNSLRSLGSKLCVDYLEVDNNCGHHTGLQILTIIGISKGSRVVEARIENVVMVDAVVNDSSNNIVVCDSHSACAQAQTWKDNQR